MDSPVSWLTLIVAIASLFIAIASLVIAIISLHRTFKKDEKVRIDLIYEKYCLPFSHSCMMLL